MVVKSFESVTLVNNVQLKKIPDPIVVTPFIVTLVNLVQPLNALSPIDARLPCIVAVVNPVQVSKAEFPMLVTVVGIVMLVNPMQ